MSDRQRAATEFAKAFPNGVTSFTRAVLQTVVNFPERHVCCKYCPFCLYDRNNTASYCAVTRQTLYAIEKGVGYDCPLELLDD